MMTYLIYLSEVWLKSVVLYIQALQLELLLVSNRRRGRSRGCTLRVTYNHGTGDGSKRPAQTGYHELS